MYKQKYLESKQEYILRKGGHITAAQQYVIDSQNFENKIRRFLKGRTTGRNLDKEMNKFFKPKKSLDAKLEREPLYAKILSMTDAELERDKNYKLIKKLQSVSDKETIYQTIRKLEPNLASQFKDSVEYETKISGDDEVYIRSIIPLNSISKMTSTDTDKTFIKLHGDLEIVDYNLFNQENEFLERFLDTERGFRDTTLRGTARNILKSEYSKYFTYMEPHLISYTSLRYQLEYLLRNESVYDGELRIKCPICKAKGKNHLMKNHLITIKFDVIKAIDAGSGVLEAVYKETKTALMKPVWFTCECNNKMIPIEVSDKCKSCVDYFKSKSIGAFHRYICKKCNRSDKCALCGKLESEHEGDTKRCPFTPSEDLSEYESMKDITVHKYGGTRRCPKCYVLTELTSGCLHIICNSCRTDWCFSCERELLSVAGTVYNHICQNKEYMEHLKNLTELEVGTIPIFNAYRNEDDIRDICLTNRIPIEQTYGIKPSYETRLEPTHVIEKIN